jgi:hypothetical protein
MLEIFRKNLSDPREVRIFDGCNLEFAPIGGLTAQPRTWPVMV